MLGIKKPKSWFAIKRNQPINDWDYIVVFSFVV